LASTSIENGAVLPSYLLLRESVSAKRVLDLVAFPPATSLIAEVAASVVVAVESESAFTGSGLRGGVTPVVLASGYFSPGLPFAAEAFDAVLGVVDHASARDLRVAIDQARSVLRSDGICALIVCGFDSAQEVFWDAQEAFNRVFEHVAVLGQSPFDGLYVSYLEPQIAAEQLSLRDELLRDAPRPAQLLVLGSAAPLRPLDAYALVSLPKQKPSTVELEKGGQVGGRMQALVAARDSEIGRLTRQAAGLEELLLDSQTARDELLARAERAEQALYELSLDRDRVDVARQSLQTAQSELSGQLEQLRGELSELRDKYRHESLAHEASQRQLARLRLQTQDLHQQLSERDEHRASVEQEREKLRERCSTLLDRCRTLGREAECQQAKVTDLEQRIELLGKEQADAREQRRELATLRSEYQTLEASRERLRGDHEELLEERRELLVALRELRHVRGDLEHELEQLRGALARLEREGAERVLALRGQLDGQAAQRKRLLQKVDEQRERLEEVVELKRLLARARAERDVGDQRSEQLELERQQLEEQLLALQQARKQLEAQLTSVVEELGSSQERGAELEEQLVAREQEVQQLSQALEQQRAIVERLRAVGLAQRSVAFEHAMRRADLEAELAQAKQVEVDAITRWKQRAAQLETAHADQLDELAQQLADQALSYELELEVRATEIGVALGQIEALEERIWRTSDEATRQAARVAAATASAENEREQIEQLRGQLDSAREQVSQLEGALAEHKQRPRGQDEQQIAAKLQRLAQLEQENRELAKSVLAHESANQELSLELQGSEQQRRSLLEKLDGSEKLAMQLRAQRQETEAVTARLHKATEILERQRQALEQLRAARRKLQSAHESKLGTLTDDLAVARDELDRARAQLAEQTGGAGVSRSEKGRSDPGVGPAARAGEPPLNPGVGPAARAGEPPLTLGWDPPRGRGNPR
jgi:chromosome segregation ATPase/SAM-dependent methyltransferase